MLGSLNEVYEDNALFYYCNACGDINIPGADPWSIHDPDELPLPAREIFENYWTEGAGLTMYVVKYKGITTMAVNALFDYGYMDDLNSERGWKPNIEAFYAAVESAAKIADDFTNYPVATLIGKDTDPDGHEILFILPPNCERAADFAEDMGSRIYRWFEDEYARSIGY